MTEDRLDQELSLARQATPVFGLGRQQQAIWGVQRRLRMKPSTLRRKALLVGAACLVCSFAVAFVWLR